MCSLTSYKTIKVVAVAMKRDRKINCTRLFYMLYRSRTMLLLNKFSYKTVYTKIECPSTQ